MVTTPEISVCDEAARAELLGLLDEEFVLSRGRAVPLAARFACAFSEPETILLSGRVAGRIACGLAIRPFVWNADGRAWRAAMIGLVYTRRDVRGRGYASALLVAAADWLRKQHCEFAVLWAMRQSFYERLGWRGADAGLLYRHDNAAPARRSADAVEDSVLWEMYRAHAGSGAQTSALRFRTLPPHASARDVFVHGHSYAVVGRDGETGYVYELGGDPQGIPALWGRIAGAYATLYTNVERGSPAHHWLKELPMLSLQEQHLAMWLPLRFDGDPNCFARWYVPFLDRM